MLINLVTNAIDAIEELDERWIKINHIIDAENNKIIFTVTDSGDGIPKEVQQKLFQPFFTTKDVGKGTGLGMAISKGIMDSHNGEFYINNHSDNTEFVLKLPIKQS